VSMIQQAATQTPWEPPDGLVIEDQARIAPEKAIVMDDAVSLAGLLQWPRGAAASSEDLNLISFPTLAVAYATWWHNRLAVSVRFDRRRDWCWVSSAEAHRCATAGLSLDPAGERAERGDGGRPGGTTPRVFDNIPVTSAAGTPAEFLSGREATGL
jgi:hypothetical protein